jgi:hypothetical protein
MLACGAKRRLPRCNQHGRTDSGHSLDFGPRRLNAVPLLRRHLLLAAANNFLVNQGTFGSGSV